MKAKLHLKAVEVKWGLWWGLNKDEGHEDEYCEYGDDEEDCDDEDED